MLLAGMHGPGMATERPLRPAQGRPNVLLVCFDDLRPVLGCYGGQAKTPNLDRFSESAVQFNRHYVQFPSCGPSRASMMSGLRADTLKLWGNAGAHAAAADPEGKPAMPLLFRNHGYTTLSFGKTYHGKGNGPGFGWSEEPRHPDSGWTCYVNFKDEGKQAKGKWRPAYEIYDGPDNLHGDHQTAEQAIKALEENRKGPFFIAAGFYKPHLPFVAPKRFWDLYQDEQIQFLKPQEIPEKGVRHCYDWSEIWAYGDQQGKMFSKERPPNPEQTRAMIRAYYAAVSFNDEQFGRILAKLDELGLSEKTAVVVWSDHGFHLGDQERWAKWTQFEADMRSPLMIRLPGAHEGGKATDAIAETVDLYPTLAEYCGLKLPDHLEGTSQLPVIAGRSKQVKDVAYSVVRPLGKENGHLRVYSMRTPEYRYIEWRDPKDGNKLVGTELYDLTTAGAETRNLAGDAASGEIIKKLRLRMKAGYRSLR